MLLNGKMLKLEYVSRKEILKQLKGNEQLLDELSEKLRLWINQHPHLPQNISDRRLKYFVSATKFDFEKAKERLDLYCSIRNWIPEIFDDFDPLSDSIIQFRKCIQFVYLPKLTSEQYRLCFARIINKYAATYDMWILIKYILMMYEMPMKENIVDTSIILVIDYKNLRMCHVKKVTPIVLKQLDVVLRAYCIRVKHIYMVNAPAYSEIMLKMIRTVMKAPLIQRMSVFTSGVESLYEKIPRSFFPSDYGGDQPSMDTLTNMWYTTLVERRNWFLRQKELKTDESRRSESSIINSNDFFGISGTFRKLDID